MRIIFFGDIVGKVGLKGVHLSLPSLREKHHPDFVIGNAENVHEGKGIDEESFLKLREMGFDCLTLGNHYRGDRDIDEWIDKYDEILRPMNLLSYYHGEGSRVYKKGDYSLRVSSFMGQAFMKEKVENPYVSVARLLRNRPKEMHFIDFHADSTSEKAVFGYAVDGMVSAVVGTHTHIQTADARILEKGTAFLTDVGMCGQYDGVIGCTKESVLPYFLEGKETRFRTGEKGQAVISYCLIDVDESTCLAKNIEGHTLISEVE